MIQAITDAINLMLLDKGLDSYINKFVLKMQPPTTQEEMDRRDNMANKIAVASDIMNLLAEIEDASAKLRILKALLSNIITDPDVMDILQEQIDMLEQSEDMGIDTTEFNNGEDNPMLGGHSSMGRMEPNIDVNMDMGFSPSETSTGSEEPPPWRGNPCRPRPACAGRRRKPSPPSTKNCWARRWTLSSSAAAIPPPRPCAP